MPKRAQRHLVICINEELTQDSEYKAHLGFFIEVPLSKWCSVPLHEAAVFTVEFFFKVDCDGHSVPLRTMRLLELLANQICYVAVSHIRIFTFPMASNLVFAATVFIIDGLFCQ